MKKILLALTIAFVFVIQTFGQVYTNKEVGKKNQELADSLKKSEYPYILPIWGAKATAKGYNLPYSAGVSVNYFTQKSELIIQDLFVGFNNGPMYDLDEVIRFDNSTAYASALTVRPDVWILPFLNIYGIFGKANSSTEINAGVWIPDTTNTWHEVTKFSTTANFDAVSAGFGMTPTLGVGGGWIALDMNVVWTDVSALDKPVFTFVFGPRVGKSFKFKNPNRNIAVWAGGFRVKFSSSTTGSMNLNEVLPVDGLQPKIDAGLIKVEDAQVAVNDWWGGLTPIEQKNPVNIAKFDVANRTIETAGNLLVSMDGALNDSEYASVQYSLNKS